MAWRYCSAICQCRHCRGPGKKMPGGSGEIHRARCSGLGEPEESVQGGDGERERESPFAVLDAAAPGKFKGIAAEIRKSLESLEKKHCGRFRGRNNTAWYRCPPCRGQKNCPVDRGNPPGNEFRSGVTGSSIQGRGWRTGKGVTVHSLRCGRAG